MAALPDRLISKEPRQRSATWYVQTATECEHTYKDVLAAKTVKELTYPTLML